MKVTLVHNPRAGLNAHEESELIAAIRAGGHEVKLAEKPEEAAFDCDLIAVAGGDGTVEKVIRRCSGAGLPFAIIPVGTANNIARSLDIRSGQPLALPQAPRALSPEKLLSIAHFAGPGHQRFFVESVGCGLVTALIRSGKFGTRGETDELRFRVKILHSLLQEFKPCDYRLLVEGRDLSGRYLLVEVMNISRVGPGLELAPEKHPGDPQLAVVTVAEQERGQLADYLEQIQRGEEPRSPFTRLFGEHIEIGCGAEGVHVDDKCYESRPGEIFTMRAGVRQLPIIN